MAKIPLRLYVLQKLTEHLQGISEVNGETVDFSDRVNRGIAVFSGSPEDWPLPRLSILESMRPDAGVVAGDLKGSRSEAWNLLLQGWVEDDVNNPTDPAHYLMAAVEEHLGRIVETNPRTGDPAYPDEYLLGPHPSGQGTLITSLAFGPGIVRPPAEQVSSKAYFYLPVAVGLATKAGQPYILG